MSKNKLVSLLVSLFVIAGIAFSVYQKRAYQKGVQEIEKKKTEIQKVVTLQHLWKVKGAQKRLHKIFDSIPKSKVERLKIERTKADIKINLLSEKEINHLLSKLAMLPVSIKKLNIAKDGNLFILETLCEW